MHITIYYAVHIVIVVMLSVSWNKLTECLFINTAQASETKMPLMKEHSSFRLLFSFPNKMSLYWFTIRFSYSPNVYSLTSIYLSHSTHYSYGYYCHLYCTQCVLFDLNLNNILEQSGRKCVRCVKKVVANHIAFCSMVLFNTIMFLQGNHVETRIWVQ